MPPPRKPIPGVPSPWSLPPRAATRSHPGTEQSEPPRGTETDYVPRVEAEGTPVPSTRHKGVSVPAWALGVIGIVAALGGAGGVKSIVEAVNAPKPATAEQQDATLEEVRAVARDVKQLKRVQVAHEKRLNANDVRWGLSVAYECRRNSKTPTGYARGQDCDPTDENEEPIIWETPPLGRDGPWKARFDWPK